MTQKAQIFANIILIHKQQNKMQIFVRLLVCENLRFLRHLRSFEIQKLNAAPAVSIKPCTSYPCQT